MARVVGRTKRSAVPAFQKPYAAGAALRSFRPVKTESWTTQKTMGFLFGTIRHEPPKETVSPYDYPVATAASPLEQVQKSETMREFVSAKLHGLRVTGKSLEYEGSASLATSLMEAAGISPYERVYLVNKSTGSRWDTYAIPGREGEFTLNGAAARLGEVGDEILLWTFRQEERFTGANVVFLNEFNKIERRKTYPAEEPSTVEF